MQIIIPGKPMGKQRARTGKGFAYTPEETINYENLVKYIYQKECGKMHEGYISAKITAYFPIPKNTSKKKRNEMALEIIRPTSKPDTDNIAKIVLDSLNGIAYKDDSQVIYLNVEKYYSDNPRVAIEITQIKPECKEEAK